MQRAARIAFVAFALAAAAVSQAPVRMPHTGRVLDKDKKPVPNAKVTLVSAGGHGGLDEGDVVRVDADADGRFRAQLQPTRSYVAWTATPCDGGIAVCAPVDVGMMPIELVAGGDKVATRFRVTGLEPWRELGPLRVELALFDGAMTIRGELDAAGTIELPPLPNENAEVNVFAKDVLVHATTFPVQSRLMLPKPHRLKVRVADDKDQPIAKAVVEYIVWRWSSSSGPFTTRPNTRPYPVATTGDDGTAEILLALDKDPFESRNLMLAFRARHDGQASGLSGFTNRAFANGKLVDTKQAKGVLPLVLTAREPTSIKVLAHEGQMPAAVQRIGYRAVPYDKDSTTSIVDSESLPVSDGVLLLEKRADDDAPNALEVPPQMPPLPPGDPWQRSARPMPLVLTMSALDKDELDLRAVLPLRLQVLDADAGPAIGAHIFCSPAAGNEFVDPAFAMHARADRSGRIVLPVLPGSWFVMAVMADGIAHAVIEAAAALPPQTLQLHAFARMRVHVVDGAGKPVEGVRFSPNGSSWTGSGTADEEMLRRVSWQVSSWTMQRCVSDAKGNADLPFVDAKGMEVRMQANKRSSGILFHSNRTAPDIRVEAGDERVEIVLK